MRRKSLQEPFIEAFPLTETRVKQILAKNPHIRLNSTIQENKRMYIFLTTGKLIK